MSEKALQSTLVQAGGLTGWMMYHTHDSRRSAPGFPDVVGLHVARRELLVLECKAARGRVSDDQKLWLAGFESVADAILEDQADGPHPARQRLHVGIANPDTLDSWLSYITKKGT